MEQKLSKEQAEKEIAAWLDAKKISATKRESQKDAIATLVEAMVEGIVIVKDDKTIVQTLKFPIEGELPLKQLEYKPRLTVNDIHTHLAGVNAMSADQRILAYVAALTQKPKALIKKLDTEDYTIPQSIALFFL